MLNTYNKDNPLRCFFAFEGLSNQSFDKWFAQRYQQLSFDFSEKSKQLNTNE